MVMNGGGNQLGGCDVGVTPAGGGLLRCCGGGDDVDASDADCLLSTATFNTD